MRFDGGSYKVCGADFSLSTGSFLGVSVHGFEQKINFSLIFLHLRVGTMLCGHCQNVGWCGPFEGLSQTKRNRVLINNINSLSKQNRNYSRKNIIRESFACLSRSHSLYYDTSNGVVLQSTQTCKHKTSICENACSTLGNPLAKGCVQVAQGTVPYS